MVSKLSFVAGFLLLAGAALAQSQPSPIINYGSGSTSGGGGGGSGTVTSITAGAGLTGGTITVSGTIALDLTHANTWTGVQSFTDGDLSLLGATSGNSILKASATGGGTATLPSGSGTLVYAAGAVTSIAGTANQITASASTGVVTLSIPSDFRLPGTINKLTLTQPATGSTITIADGKTLTASNTLTFTGTDGSSVAFGVGGTVSYAVGANPTATAGPTAVNGVATTFMRADGAPAIQKGLSSQFGIVECDNVTITCPGGVLTASGGSATSITVGTTTIVSGTNGRIEYNNSGVLGELTTTGSGTVAVLATSPTIAGLTVTGSLTATGLVTNADLANSSVTVAGKSVSLGGSITIACSDLSNGATGCSTATGTSGATIPLLNGVNTWSGAQTFTSAAPQITLGVNTTTLGAVKMFGNTSGDLTINPAAVAGTSSVITFPAGITNFSATGGTSQVIKQTSSGGAFTVARLACADLSDSSTGCSGAASATGANPTATAGPTAVNGSAATFMRSDGAPAVQKGTATQFGIVEADNTTITSASGVLSAVNTGTVTSVATNNGLTGGTITTTGTIGLAAIAADNLLANSTGSSAAPIATSIGSCSTGSSALTYNTSTHAFGCNSISGSGTVNSGTSGQLAYYASSTAAVSGNANITISGGAITLGVAGSAVGTQIFANATSGGITVAPPTGALGSVTLTLPDATDTLIGKATTDTLTHKTYDTAGTGNSFSINGNGITAVSGTGGTVALTAGPTFTGAPAIAAATGTSLSTTGAITDFNATAIPTGGTAGDGFLFSSTANNGLFFGTGAPTLTAAEGSLYLRNDTGHPYYNSTGSTTWVDLAAGGGGSGCVPAGSATQILTDNGSGACTSNTITITGTGGIVLNIPAGSAGTPPLEFGGDTTSGFYRPAANQVAFSSSGTEEFVFAVTDLQGVTTNAPELRNNVGLGNPTLVPNRANAHAGIGADASGDTSIYVYDGTFTTEAARFSNSGSNLSVVLGPYKIGPGGYATTLQVGSSANIGSDTNTAGKNGTITSGIGTGNSTGSSLIFQTPAPTTSGTGAQTQTTQLTLNNAGATFVPPIITAAGTSAAPGIGIGTATSGFYGSGSINVDVASTPVWQFNASYLASATSGGAALATAAASGTVPTLIPNSSGTTTGVGAQAAGNLSLIAGATEVVRITSTSFNLPGLTQSSAAQSGTLCYSTAGASPVTYDATLGCLASLEELKDIKPGGMPDALAEIDALKPFWYTWKPSTVEWKSDKHEQPGLGAHATEKVDPRLVGYGPDGKLRGVRYEQTVALLIAGMQQQQAEIEQLKTQNGELAAAVARLTPPKLRLSPVSLTRH